MYANQHIKKTLKNLQLIPQTHKAVGQGGQTSARVGLADRSATLPMNGARQANGRQVAVQSASENAPETQTTASVTTKRVVDFNEFQLKAARLTSAVGLPPGGLQMQQNEQQQQHQVSNIMNVILGPVAELNASSKALITGQLFVALKFVPDGRDLSTTAQRAQNIEGELHVLIKEAHNIAGFESPLSAVANKLASLPAAPGDPSSQPSNFKISGQREQQVVQPPPSGSLPNPYCKCYLLSAQGQRVAKQKTPILKRTVNPRWDHKCIFHSLKLSQLGSQAIEIHLYNRDSILVSHTNELLGSIRLCRATSSSSNGDNKRTSGTDSTTATGGADLSLSSNGSGATLLRNRPMDNANNETTEINGQLCTERESRLWNQMLLKPNIWVYGELRLRQLAPLVANNQTAPQQQATMTAMATTTLNSQANNYQLHNHNGTTTTTTSNVIN